MIGYFPYLPLHLQTWATLCRAMTSGLTLLPDPASASSPPGTDNVIPFPKRHRPDPTRGPVAHHTAPAVINLSQARRLVVGGGERLGSKRLD